MRKPKNPPPKPAGFSWNDHPVIIASGSAVAGFLLCLAVFRELVVPTQLAKLELEALRARESTRVVQASLAKVQTEKAAESQKLSRATKDLEAARGEVKALHLNLAEARAALLFTPNNPYPNGLGLVRIGMPESEIRRVYAAQQVEISPEDPDIIRVKIADSPFSSITYFVRSEGAQKGTISHISFGIPTIPVAFGEDFVYRKMIEAFGVPTEMNKDYKWDVGRYSLFSRRKDGYVLMKQGDEPLFWNY